MTFSNAYGDEQRAKAYATLEFPGTYSLAFRDLPRIISAHSKGTRALDFGCGTGRSTRFLKGLGFETVGVDISETMLAEARSRDPQGDYRLVTNDGPTDLPDNSFDIVLSAFTFDNIPTMERKVTLFHQLGRVLKSTGRIINLVSSPEIYTHEWASFSTKEYPENRVAKAGDVVRIIMTDVGDRRPIEDIIWPDDAYRETYAQAGLTILETHRPLATGDEPIQWVNETTVAPWVIYVLGRVSSHHK